MTGDRTKEHTWHTSGGLGKLGELAGQTADTLVKLMVTMLNYAC